MGYRRRDRAATIPTMSKGTWSIVISLAVLTAGAVCLGLGWLVAGSGLLYVGGSAAIGAITNRIAIKAIFSPWPSRRFPLPGTGLVERNHQRIIEAIADSVAKDLITAETLRRWLSEADFFVSVRDQAAREVRKLAADPEMRATWSEHLRVALRRRLEDVVNSNRVYNAVRSFFVSKSGLVGKIGNFTGLGDYDSITYRIVDAIRSRLGDWMGEGSTWFDEQFAEALSEAADGLGRWDIQHSQRLEEMIEFVVRNVDVRAIVVHSLQRFEPQEVRRLVEDFSKEHLGLLEVWGAVLGAIAGGAIWGASLALGLM